MKFMNTKKILFSTVIAVAMFSCGYEDFVVDYDYTAVYFPYALIDRTVIVGEYMEIGIGVVLGGRVENLSDEWAVFEIDNGFLDSSYLPLPESYYSMEEQDKFEIPAGSFQGLAKISINSERFCSDSLALTPTYALGFRLTDTSADSILAGKDSTIITFKYFNTYHGFYYHKGMSVAYSGNSVIDTIHYPEDDIWELETNSVEGVIAPEMANFSGNDFHMNLTVNPDNTVNIARNPSATVEVTGEGNFDPETRTFILEYSFEYNDLTYITIDTLIFRNRIVDGINQWDL
jgi:hypothetical protein